MCWVGVGLGACGPLGGLGSDRRPSCLTAPLSPGCMEGLMSSRMTSPSSSCSQESSKRVGQEGLGGNFYGVMCPHGSLPEVNHAESCPCSRPQLTLLSPHLSPCTEPSGSCPCSCPRKRGLSPQLGPSTEPDWVLQLFKAPNKTPEPASDCQAGSWSY